MCIFNEKFYTFDTISTLSTALSITPTYPDDLLQVAPGVVQGLHGEPGVGVGADIVGLDLLI